MHVLNFENKLFRFTSVQSRSTKHTSLATGVLKFVKVIKSGWQILIHMFTGERQGIHSLVYWLIETFICSSWCHVSVQECWLWINSQTFVLSQLCKAVNAHETKWKCNKILETKYFGCILSMNMFSQGFSIVVWVHFFETSPFQKCILTFCTPGLWSMFDCTSSGPSPRHLKGYFLVIGTA